MNSFLLRNCFSGWIKILSVLKFEKMEIEISNKKIIN